MWQIFPKYLVLPTGTYGLFSSLLLFIQMTVGSQWSLILWCKIESSTRIWEHMQQLFSLRRKVESRRKKKKNSLLADFLYYCIILGALGWEGASQVQVAASSSEVLGSV